MNIDALLPPDIQPLIGGCAVVFAVCLLLMTWGDMRKQSGKVAQGGKPAKGAKPAKAAGKKAKGAAGDTKGPKITPVNEVLNPPEPTNKSGGKVARLQSDSFWRKMEETADLPAAPQAASEWPPPVEAQPGGASPPFEMQPPAQGSELRMGQQAPGTPPGGNQAPMTLLEAIKRKIRFMEDRDAGP